MDKNKEMDESAEAPHNRIDDIRPDDGREVGGIGTDNLDEGHSRATGSDEMATGGALNEQFGRSAPAAKSAKENDSGSNQTMGIP